MIQTQAPTERYDATKALNACKMANGTSVSAHVMKMKRHIDHLERLGHLVLLQLATDTILNSLSDDYKQFVINYNMNNMEKTIAELHSIMETKTKDVLMVKEGGVKKKRGQRYNGKGKGQVQVSQNVPNAVDNSKSKGKGKKVKVNKTKTENRWFRCHEVGHWRQNCPKRHETATSDVDQKLHGYSIEQRISDVIRWLRLLRGFCHKNQNRRRFVIRSGVRSCNLLEGPFVRFITFVPRSHKNPTLVNSSLLGNINSNKVSCLSCKLGKHHALPFELNDYKSASAFDLIHSDVWGPAPHPSMGGCRYFIIFVDDDTRFAWIYLIFVLEESLNLDFWGLDLDGDDEDWCLGCDYIPTRET
ncbi:hypothetical protein OSB04_019526 [Centaurea solstitialis]|uniref:Zinc finger, CCHC-type n=1 Tax=Centaurea solstitialis TaxID=347529 RepID=A0AA38TA21_9ASTR|nr:hypothetical protein OSB04_019526 [Centaurea solstitialis]